MLKSEQLPPATHVLLGLIFPAQSLNTYLIPLVLDEMLNGRCKCIELAERAFSVVIIPIPANKIGMLMFKCGVLA